MKMEEHTAHFSIDAEWFTNLVRSLWADEDNPEKALSVIDAAFPEMSEADKMCILTGSKKLINAPNDSMDLVDDDSKQTECGNELSCRRVISKLRKDQGLLKDAIQLLADNTENRASPYGLIHVPTNRLQEYDAGNLGMEDFLWQCSDYQKSWVNREEEDGDRPRRSLAEPEEVPAPVPLKRYSVITQSTGWLSPDGNFYPCHWMQHQYIMHDLGMDPIEAEKMGWVKLDDHYGPLWTIDPNQKQIDLMFDWYRDHGKEIPWNLKDLLDK